LSIFADDRDLDVVFCGNDKRNLSLFRETTQQYYIPYNIATLRVIPFHFNIDVFTISREPKSIYFYYIPSNDQLIIYSDNFSFTKKPAVHIATNVFDEPSQPIVFHPLSFPDKDLTKQALKSVDVFYSRSLKLDHFF